MGRHDNKLKNDGHRRWAWLMPGLVIAILATGCSRPEPAPTPVRAVRTQVLGTAAWDARTEYAGDVRARTESRLAFRVSGKLVERPAQLGDTVRKGQLLARLDPQDLRLIEESARAAVVAAEANAIQAQADLERFKGLNAQGFISAAELERRSTAARAAQAQLEQARAQAGVQGRQTAHGTLVADAAGVITAIEAEPGAVVAAGTPVLRLAWDGPRDVVFAVPEDRVAAMRALLGKPAALEVRVWGQTQPMPASVREVSAAADPTTRTFLVKADLGPAAASSVRLGQTVSISLPPPDGAQAIKIPLSALSQQQGQNAVWLLDGASMTVKLQRVDVAGADANQAVIAAGLRSGQEIVTAGVHLLTPGEKVKRWGAPAAAAAASGAATPASVGASGAAAPASR